MSGFEAVRMCKRARRGLLEVTLADLLCSSTPVTFIFADVAKIHYMRKIIIVKYRAPAFISRLFGKESAGRFGSWLKAVL